MITIWIMMIQLCGFRFSGSLQSVLGDNIWFKDG